jgi:RHS repeat-associated protein
MTGDGTNTYQWDAENRLTQINYAGSGNYSQFVYDGFDRCVQITEYSGGSLTSTKIVCWVSSDRAETRNASGGVTAQFFALGETISGNSYFYTTDHLGLSDAAVVPFSQLRQLSEHPAGFNPLAHSGSIRELTNTSGLIQAQYAFDPYGGVSQLQGSLASDFQYAGYYLHAPSRLSLAVHRAYSSNFGRWIERDSIEESGGSNLYFYVFNAPTYLTDPLGTSPILTPPFIPHLPHKYPHGRKCYCIWWCQREWNLDFIQKQDENECITDCMRHHERYPPYEFTNPPPVPPTPFQPPDPPGRDRHAPGIFI